MKHFVFALCFAGLALSLAACESTNAANDGTAPYSLERTAGGQKSMGSDRVFRGGQNK